MTEVEHESEGRGGMYTGEDSILLEHSGMIESVERQFTEAQRILEELSTRLHAVDERNYMKQLQGEHWELVNYATNKTRHVLDEAAMDKACEEDTRQPRVTVAIEDPDNPSLEEIRRILLHDEDELRDEDKRAAMQDMHATDLNKLVQRVSETLKTRKRKREEEE